MDTDIKEFSYPDKFVTINNNSVLLLDKSFKYPIPLNAIKNNPLGLVKWIHHLMQKRWINREHIIQLIEISGVDYYV